jgi:hypothetical protein
MTPQNDFQPRPELLDRALALDLTPRALGLYLALFALGQGVIASYRRLGLLTGSRQQGKVSDDETLIGAARELEAAGLIERHRMPTPRGALDGPHTPYRWKLLKDGKAPRPRWLAAREAVVAFARAQMPACGPVATSCFARLAYAVGEDGQRALTRRELGNVTGFDPKTASRWLDRLVEDKAGIETLAASQSGRSRIWKIALIVSTLEEPVQVQTDGTPAVPSGKAQLSTASKDARPTVQTVVLDAEKEIAVIRDRLGDDISTRVEYAWARYCDGLRVGTTPQPATALRHFWQPALKFLKLVEEKGGSSALLASAINETTSRALGGADQRPQTFAAYTRTVLNNSLGKAGRDWQTIAEEKVANSPEVLAKQVSELLRECMAPVCKGDKSLAAIDAVRDLFKQKFPSELRQRVAEVFFGGDKKRSDACLTLAIKQGGTGFRTVTPEDATTINFLPGWRWPADLETNRQLEDEKRDAEILRQAEESMPSFEEIQQTRKLPSGERARAQALLLGNAPTLAS